MMTKILLVALVSVACAASVEKREGAIAEARDTGSSYAAPAPSYEDGSQGNLYYYYYPVSEYGHTEAAGADFDVFTAIILPLLILGGLLLLLSSLTFTLTSGSGRALPEEAQEPDLIGQLHDEIERVFYLYLNAFESEQCLQRTICEMGAYSKDFKGKDFVLGYDKRGFC